MKVLKPVGVMYHSKIASFSVNRLRISTKSNGLSLYLVLEAAGIVKQFYEVSGFAAFDVF